MAPLAQSLKTKYEFYSEKEQCPKKWLRIRAWYYVILKIVSTLVSVLMPGAALGIAYYQYLNRCCDSGLDWFLIVIVSVFASVAAFAIGHTLFKEGSYLRTVFKTIGS